MGPNAESDEPGGHATSAEVSAGEAEAWVAKGREFDAEFRQEEALAAFDRALELDPTIAVAWRSKGRALHALKRYQEAVDALERATALAPEDAKNWAEIIVPLVMLNRCDEAMAAWQRANRLAPTPDGPYDPNVYNDSDNPYGFIMWFDDEEEHDRYTECQASIRTTTPADWLTKSGALSRLGRGTEAVACLEEGTGRFPENGDLWESLAWTLKDLKRYDEALPAYELAVKLEPANAETWSHMGIVLHHLKRYEESVIALERASALDPTNVDAWSARFVPLCVLKRYAEAHETAERIIEMTRQARLREGKDANAQISLTLAANDDSEILAFHEYNTSQHPEIPSNWRSQAGMLKKMHRPDEAVACLEEALRRYPDSADLWAAQARLLDDLQRYEEAVTAFDRALALKPDDVNLWTGKAHALYPLKRYEQSLDACERALALKSDVAYLWRNKAAALIELRRYKEALACAERALALDANNASAWLLKRTCYAKLERHTDALAASEHLTELEPANPDHWRWRLHDLSVLGRYDDAVDICDEALLKNPTNADLEEWLRYLQNNVRRTIADQRMRLRDGRWLGYLDCGDPAGLPILYCYGMPGSRLNGVELDETFQALHVRLIVPDRPGCGLSDDQPRRTILDWPDDVVELADHLGLERFAVLGVSGGGPYAAACAYKISHRLTRVGLVSSTAPPNAPHYDPGANRIANAVWRTLPWPIMRRARCGLSRACHLRTLK